jgi:hypothetical protein
MAEPDRTEAVPPAELHLRGDGRQYLAAILRPVGDFGPRSNHELSILDATTGEVVKRIPLPSAAASYFPDFSDTYGSIVRTLDLDGDGTDEVLVTFSHYPYWPSFTVLCEPLRGVARLLFVGSGHHRVAGAQDLDGDGRAEVILAGINNRMGWYSALAAVKVVPWVGQAVPGRDEMAAAFSPDRAASVAGSLLWYALGPRAYPATPGGMEPRFARRVLAVDYLGRPAVEIGFDGFLTAFRSRRPPGERQVARGRAYLHLREGSRLLQEGLAADSVPEWREALAQAEAAADPYLAEWVSRELAKGLVGAGREDDGETLFRRLAADPETEPAAQVEGARGVISRLRAATWSTTTTTAAMDASGAPPTSAATTASSRSARSAPRRGSSIPTAGRTARRPETARAGTRGPSRARVAQSGATSDSTSGRSPSSESGRSTSGWAAW